jgi:hypothetical protein
VVLSSSLSLYTQIPISYFWFVNLIIYSCHRFTLVSISQFIQSVPFARYFQLSPTESIVSNAIQRQKTPMPSMHSNAIYSPSTNPFNDSSRPQTAHWRHEKIEVEVKTQIHSRYRRLQHAPIDTSIHEVLVELLVSGVKGCLATPQLSHDIR